MKYTNYLQTITKTDRLRIKFKKHRGNILQFVVNYDTLHQNHWRTVLRIDNAHGSPHKHTYYLHSKSYRVELHTDNNTAFTNAKNDILRDMNKIKQNFLQI